jgi:uncharacterized protein (DUF697 family)
MQPGQLEAEQSYDLIVGYAWKNIAAQVGASLVPLPGAGLAVDAAVLPVIYLPMWNEIRGVYGRGEVGAEQGRALLGGVGGVVLVDVVVDKVLGQVPIIGMPLNYFCAKIMTWRLGALFTLFASLGDDVDARLARLATELLTKLFPKEDFGLIKTPARPKFVDFILKASSDGPDDLEDRFQKAMDVLGGGSGRNDGV